MVERGRLDQRRGRGDAGDRAQRIQGFGLGSLGQRHPGNGESGEAPRLRVGHLERLTPLLERQQCITVVEVRPAEREPDPSGPRRVREFTQGRAEESQRPIGVPLSGGPFRGEEERDLAQLRSRACPEERLSLAACGRRFVGAQPLKAKPVRGTLGEALVPPVVAEAEELPARLVEAAALLEAFPESVPRVVLEGGGR